MRRERIFEIAKEAGFTRIKECYPGVEYKLCSNDVWKGDLSMLLGPLKDEFRKEFLEEIKKSGTEAQG